MLLLLIVNVTAFSQTLSITNIQRDSIVSKIIRGNTAIAENSIIRNQLKTKDSVIKLQTTVIDAQQINLQKQHKVINNNNLIISNQNKMIANEKKRGKRKGFFGFVKGVVAGISIILIIK